jgi:competence protein ComEA
MASIDPKILERINEKSKRALPRLDQLKTSLTSQHKRALLAVAICAIAISVLSLIAAQVQPAEEVVAAEPTMSAGASAPSLLVVDVQGSVVNPGIYQLPLGSRVADAIKAAGGVIAGSDSSTINLARFIEDGEQIYLSEVVEQVTGSSGGSSISGGKLNLNRATESELDALPGVGPVLAKRITGYRSEHGNFGSIDELRKVTGIGPAKFRELSDFVTV